MEIPKTYILQPATRYPVGQATSDSKGSSTPGLTYSPNVPNERKIHIPATPKTGLSSDSPKVVNTHPERRRLEFSKTQHEEQGTLPTTNTPTLITHPAEPHSHDMCCTLQRKSIRASRPLAWHSDYNMDQQS